MKTPFEKMRAGRVRCESAKQKLASHQIWRVVDGIVLTANYGVPTNEQQAKARLYEELVLFNSPEDRSRPSFWRGITQMFWPTNRGQR